MEDVRDRFFTLRIEQALRLLSRNNHIGLAYLAQRYALQEADLRAWLQEFNGGSKVLTPERIETVKRELGALNESTAERPAAPEAATAPAPESTGTPASETTATAPVPPVPEITREAETAPTPKPLAESVAPIAATTAATPIPAWSKGALDAAMALPRARKPYQRRAPKPTAPAAPAKPAAEPEPAKPRAVKPARVAGRRPGPVPVLEAFRAVNAALDQALKSQLRSAKRRRS